MKRLNVMEITRAVEGSLHARNDKETVTCVTTDSRSAGSLRESVFFAIEGMNFDGHDYIDNAVSKNCRVIVLSKKDMIPEDSELSYILVDDTLLAYQSLAKYYREVISPVTIGITGSVGKTSLKDMVNAISSEYFNTVCSEGNENNHIGVPKTIFRMEENTEVLILEMGMSNKGEIKLLADIGRPSVAAITNIGFSHIENFSKQEDIFDAKMEITGNFTDNNTLVVNGDDPYLKRVKEKAGFEVLTAGISENIDFMVCDARYLDDRHITFLIEYDNGVERFTLPVAGLYNGMTAAMATAIMSKLDISVANCASSLRNLRITPNRLQLIDRKGIRIIDDTYNASPASMSSAMEYLSAVSNSKRKLAVLADMKELGDMSIKLHREVGNLVAASSSIDYLFTIGELGKEIGKAAVEQNKRIKVTMFDDRESCIRGIREIINDGDLILVKGSHSMEMEEIVKSL